MNSQMEYYERLKWQHLSGEVEVKRTFGKGGLWGGSLCIFEWEVYSPSRGYHCHYSAVFMPIEGKETGPNAVRHVVKRLSDSGFEYDFERDWRLEIVVAHHEGTYTATFPEFKEFMENFKDQYKSGDRNIVGIEQSIKVIDSLMAMMVQSEIDYENPSIPEESGVVFKVGTNIKGTEEALRD